MSRITLVATSHIAEESLRKIEETIRKEQPDCVTVELDVARFLGMTRGGGRPSVREFGVAGVLLFSLMRGIQNWLGKKVGILPGTDMLKAVELARNNGIPVFFIDRDIRATFLRIKSIGWKEKVRLLFLLVKGIALGPFLKGEEIDLRKVPEERLLQEVMTYFKEEFPTIYRILITERDAYMAHHLFHLSQKYKKIVAVIGAGHKEGLMKLLKG